MKKLKSFVIVIVILGVIAGGIYGGYKYSNSKKIAQVVAMSMEGMDGYWGDSIESYGMVESEKSQTTYIASGTEILSVNVKTGEHVNEGDVLMTVMKESQDIKGKTLSLQKATEQLGIERRKLERLQNTKPIPEYVHSADVYRDREYVGAKNYIAKEALTIDEVSYEKDDIIAIYSFDSDGEELGVTVLNPGFTGDGSSYKEIEDEAKIEAITAYIKNSDNADKITFEEETVTDQWLASVLYFDGETKQIVGEDTFDERGRSTHNGKPEGMKPSELAEAISEQTAVVNKQDLECRKMASELEAMENTTDNGQILAKVSGTVSKIQDKDNYNTNQPFMVVSATDEYYISGSVGEFHLDSVNVGDTVSIMSWDNGNSAEAVIASISDSPSKDSNYFGGSGNTNISNYQFKATFDKSNGIEIGSAVDITITPAGQEEGGFYIPSYYVRKDVSGSFVMKMNEEGVLQKEYVKVGKTLWGYMTEIKQGVTAEDYLAFPYGNGAIEGIPCEITDSLDDMYGGLG